MEAHRRSLRSGQDDKEEVPVPQRVDSGPRCLSLPWVGRRPMTPPVGMTKERVVARERIVVRDWVDPDFVSHYFACSTLENLFI